MRLRTATRIALALLLAAAGCAKPSAEPIDDPYDFVLSIDDLAEYMGTSEFPPERGVLARHRTAEGGHALTYEYDSENPPLYLFWEVVVHDGVVPASRHYESGGDGIRLGSALASRVDFVPHHRFVSWGNDSSYFTIESGGEPVGSGFLARSGRRTVLLLLTGVYFDSRATFDAVVGPKLQKALLYDPDTWRRSKVGAPARYR